MHSQNAQGFVMRDVRKASAHKNTQKMRVFNQSSLCLREGSRVARPVRMSTGLCLGPVATLCTMCHLETPSSR